MTADRLQTATRIHFLLRRSLGEGIAVERMLRDERYARDVLLVCDALAQGELPALAAAFRAAPRHGGAGAPAGTHDAGALRPPVGPRTPRATQPGWLESTFRRMGL